MKIETMIYIYGAICLCMITFNILYSLLLRRSQPRLEKRCQKLQILVDRQLAEIRAGRAVNPRHLDDLCRRLRHISNLIAFDRILRPVFAQKQNPTGEAYLRQIQPAVLYLAALYQKRENMQAAYFSYFLSQYAVKRQAPVDTMQELLLGYVQKQNLYCRIQALQALCACGNVDYMIKALALQDDDAVFLHEKILTEGLLSFTGDADALIRRLWETFDTFSEHTQLAVLNYIRFKTGGCEKEMFALMQDPARGKELRLAAIRYFGRYPYAPALQPLLSFAADPDPTQWEYTTVSVCALARYPEPAVQQVLKEALHNANWYVRYAAANSLEAQQADYADMMDVLAGNDRYAREMLSYRLEARKLKKAGV